jgi:hypothetical protein
VASGSGPGLISASSETELRNPVSQLIMVTLDIPLHLTLLNKGHSDLHMGYAKFLAINDANERLTKMCKAGT